MLSDTGNRFLTRLQAVKLEYNQDSNKILEEKVGLLFF